MTDPIRGWLRGVANRMIVDFESSATFEHASSRGASRERSVVREFLSRYLPGHVRIVHSGEIRSSQSEVSRQQDIVLVDITTPALYQDDTFQVLPIECVYVTGEVKSDLDRSELESAWNNVRSVKIMRKDAIRPPGNTFRTEPTHGLHAYGRAWAQFPVASFLFATDSISLTALADKLDELRNTTVAEHRIDAIFVLRRGVLGWTGPDGQLQYRPTAESDILFAECEPERVLLWMNLWLWEILSDAWRAPLDLRRYLTDHTLSTRWTIR